MSDAGQAETDLSVERFEELRAGGAELVDVRRDDEFEAGRLAGARHIELGELPAQADSLERDRALLFYCRTGNRSSMAVAAFREAGFEAFHLAGGIEAWVEAGRPLEPEDGEVRSPGPPS